MDIMLTVSYSLKIPRDQFFNSKNGYVKAEIRKQLEKLFPKEISLLEDTVAQREHLIHMPLYENKNSLKCASCGKWLYMPEKEFSQACLEYCKIVKDIPLCPSCAWELEADFKNEEFIQKLRKKSVKSNGDTFAEKDSLL
ncbi:hypothetical protein D5278_16500 [bacterium 1XD21-13]|nr:hypothetical protein [bacterium 1XD21-13]